MEKKSSHYRPAAAPAAAPTAAAAAAPAPAAAAPPGHPAGAAEKSAESPANYYLNNHETYSKALAEKIEKMEQERAAAARAADPDPVQNLHYFRSRWITCEIENLRLNTLLRKKESELQILQDELSKALENLLTINNSLWNC